METYGDYMFVVLRKNDSVHLKKRFLFVFGCNSLKLLNNC